jgi:hypothetical protein
MTVSVFEIVTAVFFGILSGAAMASIGGWKWIGLVRLFCLGALGGAIGALIGAAYSAGPAWGDMSYHPMAALFACLGGASAIAALRLLQGDGSAGRRVPAVHREGPSR